jgi:hypothetical protein
VRSFESSALSVLSRLDVTVLKLAPDMAEDIARLTYLKQTDTLAPVRCEASGASAGPGQVPFDVRPLDVSALPSLFLAGPLAEMPRRPPSPHG